MSHFRAANHYVVRESEGGYVFTDTPLDRGGPTYAGISRVHNPDWPGWKYLDRDPGDVRNPNLIQELEYLYRTRYWHPALDGIASRALATIVHSCMVLFGPRTGVRFAQRAAGVEADGIPGPKTVAALNSGDWTVIGDRIVIQRVKHHCDVVKVRPPQIKFLRGWIARALRENALVE